MKRSILLLTNLKYRRNQDKVYVKSSVAYFSASSVTEKAVQELTRIKGACCFAEELRYACDSYLTEGVNDVVLDFDVYIGNYLSCGNDCGRLVF